MNDFEFNECVAAAARLRAAGVISIRQDAVACPRPAARFKPGPLMRFRQKAREDGFIPQKYWLSREAERLGLAPASLLNRLRKNNSLWPPRRKFNARVIYVKDEAMAYHLQIGRVPKYDWSAAVRRKFAGQGARLHRMYMRVWRGTMTLQEALSAN